MAVVDWPWFVGTIAVHGSGTVILAMYTFIVGPWLPTKSAISGGLVHKPAKRERHRYSSCTAPRAFTLLAEGSQQNLPQGLSKLNLIPSNSD